MSLNSDLVSINDHNQWFKNASNSKNSLLLMCSRNPNTKIAFVHFKLNMTDAYVSINLNPDERGKGLSREVLKQAIEYLLFHHSQCQQAWQKKMKSQKHWSVQELLDVIQYCFSTVLVVIQRH